MLGLLSTVVDTIAIAFVSKNRSPYIPDLNVPNTINVRVIDITGENSKSVSIRILTESCLHYFTNEARTHNL